MKKGKEEREDEGNIGENINQGQADAGKEMGTSEGENEEKTHQREKAGTKREGCKDEGRREVSRERAEEEAGAGYMHPRVCD